MKAGWILLLMAAVLSLAMSLGAGSTNPAAATSMERKLRAIENNGSSAHPHPTSTQLTEEEINAYFAGGNVDLPAGVESIRFRSEPGVISASTRVDFDKLKTGDGSFNPLLEIFRGVHDAVVVAHAHGAGGVGYVQIDSVSLDGVNIPQFVLQLFVEKYVQPRYPGLGLESKFDLPDRIDSATVGAHEVTVTQR